tara:strand:+ start:4287 stop:4655 length:369 start_codon:yes stop_codon:yes gene_type:complete
MKTYIRLNGQNIDAVVTSKIKPDGYTEVSIEDIPPDFFMDMTAYTFDGVYFSRRVVSQVEERDKLSMELRISRNRNLSASDWTQVADAPVDHAAWAAYRQALRDITKQDGFPESVVWPAQPV